MAGIAFRLGKYYKSIHFTYGQVVIYQSTVYRMHTLSIEIPFLRKLLSLEWKAAAIFSVLQHYLGEYRMMLFPQLTSQLS